MNFNLPQTIKNFPQRKKKYPKNLTPAHKLKLVVASICWEYHFVVNYSIRAHYKARGQMSRTCGGCVLTFPEASLSVWAHLCWIQASQEPVTVQ